MKIFVIEVVLLVLTITISIVFGMLFLAIISSLFLVASLVYVFIVRTRLREKAINRSSRQFGILLGDHILKMSPDGIDDHYDDATYSTSWTNVKKVILAKNIVLITTQTRPYIIPKRAFKDIARFDKFINGLRSCCQTDA